MGISVVMKSSVIIITVLVLSIAVIAVVHAQASVGLEVSYEVHLQVAEQWVAKLNEYGINTTAVNQLISKAQVEASVGNYTEAIILLNQAVALSAQLMSNYLSNSTSVVMSNYASTVTDLNSHVEASLNNSNVTTSVLLKALGYVNGYVNSGNFSGALRTITLLNATINTAAAISPGISTTAQAVIPTLSRLYLELKGAEYAQNITAAQLALFRAEVLIVTEVVSKPVREEYLYSIISNWEHQLINEVNSTYLNITSAFGLKAWSHVSGNVSECLSTVNNLVPSVAVGTVNPQQLIGNYTTCLAKVKTIVLLANSGASAVNEIEGESMELYRLGYVNYSSYLMGMGNLCIHEMLSSAIAGDVASLNANISNCTALASQYGERIKYALTILNISRHNIEELNETLMNQFKAHGLGITEAMLCWVRIYGNLSSVIDSEINSILNGTVTPPMAINAVNNYFISLNSSIQSIVAGCLNITTPGPGRYIPMIGVSQEQPQVVPIGLELSTSGSMELSLLVINPTQANLYINGFGLGGLKCSFNNELTLNANSQGTLVITLYPTNNAVMGIAKLTTYSGVTGSQKTMFTCAGSQTFMVGTYYMGYLMLTNNEELQFQIRATDSTIPFNW
jgi:tetratricopeptide (TPR) repeat protein